MQPEARGHAWVLDHPLVAEGDMLSFVWPFFCAICTKRAADALLPLAQLDTSQTFLRRTRFQNTNDTLGVPVLRPAFFSSCTLTVPASFPTSFCFRSFFPHFPVEESLQEPLSILDALRRVNPLERSHSHLHLESLRSFI